MGLESDGRSGYIKGAGGELAIGVGIESTCFSNILLASQQYLHAKNTAGSQRSIPTNICCHKPIKKQDASLSFTISVLGLRVHYEAA